MAEAMADARKQLRALSVVSLRSPSSSLLTRFFHIRRLLGPDFACGVASDDEENDVGVDDDDISGRRVEGCDDESDDGDVRCWLLRPGFACSDANDDEESDVGDGDDDIALRHVEVCDDDGDVHCRLKGPVLCAATQPPYGLSNLPPSRF